MTELNIQPEKLLAASQEFKQSGTDIQNLLERLDKVTESLKSDWEGAAQQIFYKEYAELRPYLTGVAQALTEISDEMSAIVVRYGKADQE